MKREFIDPSTTTEADRALRLRKDLADAQAKLREAEQWREQASKASKLERELSGAQEKLLELDILRERASRVVALERDLASATARCQELEEKVLRLSKRPTQDSLQRAEVLASEVEVLRDKAGRVISLEKALRESEERAAKLEARLRNQPPPTPRHVERCAQAKLNRRLFAENERLKQEARNGL